MAMPFAVVSDSETEFEAQRVVPGTRSSAAAGSRGGTAVGALGVLACVATLSFKAAPSLGGPAREGRPSKLGSGVLEGGVQRLQEISGAELDSAHPNDFWGIHDLLLVGYKAHFMKAGSAGLNEVRAAALDVAKMLPRLHPVAQCRTDIQAVLASGAVGKELIVGVADAAWSCLPAKFTAEMFDKGNEGGGAFVPGMLDEEDELGVNGANQARDPKIKDTSILGVCRNSGWHRTCSYWVSMHVMARRADSLGMGTDFFQSVLKVLAGGATMCGGCTLHLQSLHEPVISKIMDDTDDVH